MRRYLWVVLAGLLMLLCACGAGEREDEITQVTVPEEPTSWEEPTSVEVLSLAENYWISWDKRQPNLMAQDAEHEAYLYGFINGRGAVLLYKSHPCYLDWECYVLKYGYPAMKVADFDGCGREEIAIPIQTGWGTGYHPERLYIIKPKPCLESWKTEETPSWENYDYLDFTVYDFGPMDMRAQIDEVVTFEETRGDDGIIHTFSDGKKTISGPPLFVGASFEGYVSFSFDDDGSIYMSAVAGSNCGVTAKVQFKDGRFTLIDIALGE